MIGNKGLENTFRSKTQEVTWGWENCVIRSYTVAVLCQILFGRILRTVQRDATQSSLFTILQVSSTCFGRQPHPSAGVHKTITTASGTGHTFCAATSLQRGQARRRYNTKQSVYYSARSMYMFRVSTTPIINTQNRNYSLRYSSWCAVQLPPSNVAKSLATLEGGSCTKNMTSTGGCSYSFVYSCWWMWLTPETCRVNVQNNK